ncbi:hypothetical protein FORMA_00370 [Formosa sp. Hel3_A1_48]|nr:hypothetical protein FORMA_00370 [Formosa sp. Hel3_A1_48]
MRKIDIITDITSVCIYTYFINIIVKKIRYSKTKRLLYIITLLGITFLLSRRVYDYL